MNPASSKIKFNNKILVVGCGTITQALCPLLLETLEFAPQNLTLMDKIDVRSLFPELVSLGVNFVVEEVTKENYKQVYPKYMSSGDLMIDLAVNICTISTVKWCTATNVMYINTALFDWGTVDNSGSFEFDPNDESNFYAETASEVETVNQLNKETGGNSATIILAHGANPGLVSHFTKQGLVDIATKLIAEKPTDPKIPLIKEHLAKRNFNLLSQALGVRVVQISEWDDQRSRTFEKGKHQFISSWNVLGFCEEMAASAEFPWGTHEVDVPFVTAKFKGKQEGEKSFFIAGQPAQRTWAKSYIPGKGEFVGMTCHHEETITISNYLSVRNAATSKLEYQPTCYFSYRPCEMALQSASEFAANKYVLAPGTEQKILFDEITDGADSLGVFLLGHDFKGWWIGSLLDIHQTRKFYKNGAASARVNSTSLQVAISVISAVSWMIEHPQAGVHFPETINSEEIIKYSKPFLGTFVSTPVDWQPVSGSSEAVWQFSNFVSQN